MTSESGLSYEIGHATYFANSKYPRKNVELGANTHMKTDNSGFTPITVIVANESQVTAKFLDTTIANYLSGDDVFSTGFLSSIYITSPRSKVTINRTALEYMNQTGVSQLYLDSTAFKDIPDHAISVHSKVYQGLAPGPYTALISAKTVSFLDTYRLYGDTYRNFITGIYPSNDGTGSFVTLPSMNPRVWAPMIPVPSRIYSWNDSRPLAGRRVAVKDIFDMKGLQTSGGSQAWIQITPISNSTAPAIKRLIDLGAVLVGKYKLAQFGSGANPWDWTDEQYPFNPRGDGYLTCSGSSSGGGCSVAAYDWLDNAIGTDTGSSMRRPAAVSGTFGNRPSQGMMTLDRAIPVSWGQDTVGVFGRDPKEWGKFVKAWCIPDLYQNSSITGLPPLSVPDTLAFPRRILYPDEYFPMKNPSAQTIFQSALTRMADLFNMSTHHFNFSNTVKSASIFSDTKANWARLANDTVSLNVWPQYVAVTRPLLSTWAERDDGRFPPVDGQLRAQWTQMDSSFNSQKAYDRALSSRAKAVEWFERHILYQTNKSCSESLIVCDENTGGIPSFREHDPSIGPNATLLSKYPEGATIPCYEICPLFGCADVTIPIGQVPYLSPISMVVEQWPVSFNLIVRRGCDFVLLNMVEKMAEAGIIKSVKTGRTAF
ncbi:amidase family protein [Aspergillus heteromorphus CBS 117.55]|uniref:Amidase family protein n=1 Tax=Aspergillus heteromorphus CBS 117.55 TaxID=1448321 RepID=A0A317W014_9EURO|nr:amidase family protein [Aspergillus heteromorphus CBS 117.55]PWY79239.1 amidase family protein [Aspergillus heteromorphus CBS 117.55]